VLEQLRERGWQLGAEGSGHILALDRHTTGDGIISALLVLAAIKRSGASLSQLLQGVSLFPQHLINVRMRPGAQWKESTAIRQAVSQAEAALDGSGRVLIRASGTEPVLRVMVEASEREAAVRHAQDIARAVEQATA
jgi:phosphoglucosamine mutase